MNRRVFWLAAMLAAANSAFAGAILKSKVSVTPERIYVNQPFELQCEITVTFGSEMEDIRFFGLPKNDAFRWERIRKVSQTRETMGDTLQSVTVHRFAVDGRASAPADLQLALQISCSLVERVNSGLFSHWRAFPQQCQLKPVGFKVLELPEAGRPDDFSGAIGKFALRGSLSKSEACPGDIAKLTLVLDGKGWLGDCAVPQPKSDPAFKIYPPKTIENEPLKRRTEQVWIPLGTQASEIPAASLSFFNPASGKYEQTSAGPFKLTVSESAAPSGDGGVKVIHTELPPEETPAAITPVNLAALISKKKQLPVKAHCEARLAPSAKSASLFQVSPGAKVTPLESANNWVRVEFGGRRGWIPGDMIESGQ